MAAAYGAKFSFRQRSLKISLNLCGTSRESLIHKAHGDHEAEFIREGIINVRNTKSIGWTATVCTCLWLAAMPAKAQYNLAPGFTFVTNNGAITITSYISSYITGPGGEVDIPASTNGYPVTGIATNAFASGSPTSILIPASITNIGEGAFGFCPFLTNLAVAPGNSSYTNVGGVLFNESMTLLLQFPAGLTTNSYTVPGTTTRIGAYAFDGCSKLGTVMISNYVSSIGEGAFFYCSSLTNVNIPNGITSIADYAFIFCGVQSVTIPGSVTNIGFDAFQNCYNLTNLSIGYGVTSIGVGGFSDCLFTSVVIPQTVTNLDDFAIWNCVGLTGVYFLGDAPAATPYTFANDDRATAYYLPGTAGWTSSLGGIPTAPWLPLIQTVSNSAAGGSAFGFNVSWASGQTVVVETCTNLSNPDWQPLQTNTLTTGTLYFSDAPGVNHPNRFYRVRSP